ncbi:unnamed protein product [Adineta steineri]|uniref:DUF229 domain containing protein n=1 Tax=Adineta steineri TaxID=433720 RepID=A0A814X811_9BILA|nr:unnamed protein product [Adineta steineri]CAF3640434.1 unnamed protein product [Adineta steineri]
MCGYTPIIRVNDDFKTKKGDRIFPVVDKMPLVSDFFHIDCKSQDNSTYSNPHMGLMFDPLLHARSMQKPMVKTHLGYNVLMFGFDSVSRYNIVGDGTPAALFPILTGQTERELPESRRGYAGAQTVDDFPWIWKQFRDNGYVTQWAEDMQNVGTFQYRLLGFRSPPVDHFGRPFYRFAEPQKTSRPHCFGSITRLRAMFDWIRNLFDMYRHQPKFSYLFHSHYSHDSNNRLPYADNELLAFLQMMHTNGYLDHTMLVIMTDHGARFASLRKTYQGKLEERLPFMSIRMPPKFQAQYPTIMRNLRLNSHRLTTPFDIHETFEHLFDFHSNDHYQSKSNRSISLFELVPENRTCAQADVAQHWCACYNWQGVSTNELIIQQYSQAAVDFLNKFASEYKQECATLSLFRVNKASQLKNDNHRSNSIHSNDKNSSLHQTNESRFYQIQFETKPGEARFEVTAEYDPKTKTFDIHRRHLSRTNKYGETSACIAQKRPDLREICYCSSLLINTTIFSTTLDMNNKIKTMIGETAVNASSVHP